MDSILPSYSEFVKLERETLMLLRNKLAIRKTLSVAGDDAQKCLGRDKHNTSVFGFCTYWDVPYMEVDCRVFLGAGIKKSPLGDKVCETSYYVSIAEGTEVPSRILRKFHFDYVTENEKKERAEPRFHLQYGGELPQEMERCGVTDKHIESLLPKVREPRIFFSPMTIGLLMNMIFFEFPTEDTDRILKESYWQNLVRQNEREILKPFYQKCATLAGKDNAVFFDEVYVH